MKTDRLIRGTDGTLLNIQPNAKHRSKKGNAWKYNDTTSNEIIVTVRDMEGNVIREYTEQDRKGKR